ncbi:hypothetical protein [uncultured Paracoccus sp.]|uniref:hypothetical protein n=1 Tax=uncultured Paracoccus sp. TaxID=189685 RepID=UPI0025CF73C5|nr:hypothetical protein [uncultured Paracoccus sp.]
MSAAADKELAALMLRLAGLDLHSADGRAGAGAILREIETKAPGTLARLRTACASRGATAH